MNALPDALLYVYLIGFLFLNQKFVLDLFFTYFLTPHIVFLSSAYVTDFKQRKTMKKKSRRFLRTDARTHIPGYHSLLTKKKIYTGVHRCGVVRVLFSKSKLHLLLTEEKSCLAEGSIGLFLGWWRVLNALPDALL